MDDDANASRLRQMLEAARALRDLVMEKTWDDYCQDGQLRQAIHNSLVYIGELAEQVSRPYRESHLEIPWSRLAEQPEMLTRQPESIDHALVWRVAIYRIPMLVSMLERYARPV